ncbi:retention module-containing protein [Campylobacter suis]|uniref:Bacterial Ig-like domain-containing protein n=1 Tax=Campylobacter suis TaxID=2790657 RepID=A0ABM8Q820_9BACT|nr:retention module-containing protein [Campylobacter suis]CAD7288961.1 hypothetical protein LMG8286_01578 [Campylobacter suis]
MAPQVGIVKEVTGGVIAIDSTGKQRVLMAGDALFLGEVVKTHSGAKAILSMDNGESIALDQNDIMTIDQSSSSNVSFGDDSITSELAELQKAILAGEDLTQLEETAAGGVATAGGGEGTAMLNESYFAQGGSESNVYADGRDLGNNGFVSATPIQPIGTGSDTESGTGETDVSPQPDPETIEEGISQDWINENEPEVIEEGIEEDWVEENNPETIEGFVNKFESLQPTLNFAADINNDGTINKTEHEDATNSRLLVVSVPKEIENGDKLFIDVSVTDGLQTQIELTYENASFTDKEGNKYRVYNETQNEITTDKKFVPIENLKIADEQTAKATAYYQDKVGNESQKGTDTATFDTTAPTVDVESNRDGSVDVKLPSDTDAKTLKISYTDESGKIHEATYTNNNGIWVKDRSNTDKNLPKESSKNSDGEQVIKLGDAATKAGTEVSATATDTAGNVGSDKDTALALLTAPTITYEEGGNKDNILTRQESSADGVQTKEHIGRITLEKLDKISVSIFEGEHEITSRDWQNGGATKEQAASDGDINNATARIKLPQNMVTGDVIKILIDDNFKGVKIPVEVKVVKNADNTFSFTETTDTGKVGIVENVAVKDGFVSLDVKEIPTHSRDDSAPVVGGGYTTQVKVELIGLGGDEKREAKVEHQIMKDIVEVHVAYNNADDNGVLSIAKNLSDGSDLRTTKATITLPVVANVGDKVDVSFKIDGDEIQTASISIKGGDTKETALQISFAEISYEKDGIVKTQIVPAIPGGRGKPFFFEIDAPVEPGKSATTDITYTGSNQFIKHDIDTASIDVQGLSAPIITEVSDDVAGGVENSQVLRDGGLTNDNTPSIKGTADANSVVNIYDNGTIIGSTQASSDGKFVFTPSSALSDGLHKFTATAFVGGVMSEISNAYSVNVDTKVDFELEAEQSSKDINGNYTKVVTINPQEKEALSIVLKDEANPNAIISKPIMQTDGSYKITIDYGKTAPNAGKISATATDMAGNTNSTEVITQKTTKTIKVEPSQLGFSSSSYVYKLSGEHLANISGINIDAEYGEYVDKGGIRAIQRVIDSKHISPSSDLSGNKFSDARVVYDQDVKNAGESEGLIVDKAFVMKGHINVENGSNTLYVKASVTDSVIVVKIDDTYVTNYASKPFGSDTYTVDLTKFGIDMSSGLHSVEILIGVPSAQYDRLTGDKEISVGLIDSDGSKVTFGQKSSAMNLSNVFDETLDVSSIPENATFDDKTKSFVYESSDTSAQSAKTTDPLAADDNANTINGSEKDEYIDAKAGIDRLFGGDGDDSILYDENDELIDGGSGHDKLMASDKGTINLDKVAEHSKNIEEVDVSGGNSTTININLTDVVALTDENNKLKITGDEGDKVDFKDSGWKKGQSTADGYDIYTNSNDTSIIIEIKQGVDVDL